jgi:hypothetical protein
MDNDDRVLDRFKNNFHESHPEVGVGGNMELITRGKLIGKRT